MYFFLFNDTATTEIYTYGHTLSLHDALPILTRQLDQLGRPIAIARELDRARLAVGANLIGREQRHAQLLFGRLADRRSRIALVEHLIEAQPAHRHFGATAQARVMRRHALVPDAQERIEEIGRANV